MPAPKSPLAGDDKVNHITLLQLKRAVAITYFVSFHVVGGDLDLWAPEVDSQANSTSERSRSKQRLHFSRVEERL